MKIKLLPILITLLILSLLISFKATLCQDETEEFRGRRGRRPFPRGRRYYPGLPWWRRWWPGYWGSSSYWPTSTWWSSPGGRYCRNCGDYGRGGCSSCINCGFAINESGTGQCVPGDARGPYFQQDAVAYQ